MNLKNSIKEFGYTPLEIPTCHIEPFGILKNTNSWFEKISFKEPVFQNTFDTFDELFDCNILMEKSVGNSLDFSVTDELNNVYSFSNVQKITIFSVEMMNYLFDKISEINGNYLNDIKNGNLYIVDSLLMSNKIEINNENPFDKILYDNGFNLVNGSFNKKSEYGLVLGITLCKIKIKNGSIVLEHVNNLKTITIK